MVSELQKLKDFIQKQHEGLVPKKVEVHPKTGRTFQRTQWVRPEEAEEVKEIKIPPGVIEDIHKSFSRVSEKDSSPFRRSLEIRAIREDLEPVYKEHGFDPSDVISIFSHWKVGSRTNKSIGFMSYLLMKKDTGTNEDEVIKSILDVISPGFTKEHIKGAVAEIKNHIVKSKSLFDFHKKLIDSIIGNKKLVLYRGANGSTFKEPVGKGSKLTINDTLPISRWTLQKDVAVDFMREKSRPDKEAHVLMVEVGADKIHYADGISLCREFTEEVEFGIDASGLDAEVIE